MRSKRILDDFDTYKKTMFNKGLPKSKYSTYDSSFDIIIAKYKFYLSNIRHNAKNSIKLKINYLKKILSYFNLLDLHDLSCLNKEHIIKYTNYMIDKGIISQRRYFEVLREFTEFLFTYDIVKENYKYTIPRIKNNSRKRISTYFKTADVEKTLNSIPKITKAEKRNYAIILIAARLGLRISDILNIKIKNIDWINDIIIVEQQKNKNINSFPLTKEIGLTIIDYKKNSRPISKSEYLFLQIRYPFDKMNNFTQFNKYFEKTDLKIDLEHKNGIHNLRNSLATNLLDKEIPLPIISSILGDKYETVINNYIKVDKKKLKSFGLELNIDEL